MLGAVAAALAVEAVDLEEDEKRAVLDAIAAACTAGEFVLDPSVAGKLGLPVDVEQ